MSIGIPRKTTIGMGVITGVLYQWRKMTVMCFFWPNEGGNMILMTMTSVTLYMTKQRKPSSP